MNDENHRFDGIRKPEEHVENGSQKSPKKGSGGKNLKIFLAVAALLFIAGGIFAAISLYKPQVKNEEESQTETTPPALGESVKVENQTAYVAAIEGLRLRKESNAESAIITTMPYGSKLAVLERAGGWLKVRYGKTEGWCMSEYTNNEKPKDLSVKDVDFSKIISIDPAVGTVLVPVYGDYNKDGREEALVKVLYDGSGQIQEFYVYGYKDGVTLTKYLEVTKQTLPDAYVEGNQGHEKMIFAAGKLVMTYPLYKKEDPNCCPTGGTQNIYFKWNGRQFIVERKETKA